MQTVLPKSRLTIDQAAETLGLEAGDVMRLIAKNRIAAVTVNGQFEIGVAELDRAANAGRLASDLNRPADLETNFQAEKRARQRLAESLADVLTPAAIRAEMVKVARPGQKVWDVPSVQFDLASPPMAFLEALGQPVDAGEFRARIKGEDRRAVETLRVAYLKSRARKAARGLLGINQSPDSIYETPQRFAEVMGQVVARLEKETISVRETKLVEFQTSAIEMGSERQVIMTKTPVTVTVTVPLASVAGSGLRALVETFF